MPSSGASFDITLRSTDGFDPFNEREFTLTLNQSILIGRASKNTTKKQLMSARDNAYIDSPVISREHALISANANSGSPRVYLTDSGSMHGTTVNGDRLEPNKPQPLSNGDQLQFGINVTRNESFFKAQNYVFESRLSSPQTTNTFAHGFSVPEGDSSEEEEVQVDSSPRPARYGTQYNPVTIDDSDDFASASVIRLPTAVNEVIEVEEMLLQPETEHESELEPAITSDTTDERSSSPRREARMISPEVDEDKNHVVSSDIQSVVLDDESVCEEDDPSIYSSDADDVSHAEEDSVSDDGSIEESEVDYPSGSEESDAEAEEEAEADSVTDTARRLKMEAMLNHENEKSASEIKSSMTASLPPMPTEPSFTSPATVQSSSRHEPPPPPSFIVGTGTTSPFGLKSASNSQNHTIQEPGIDTVSMFDDPWADNAFVGVGLPPRPAAPKPAPWNGSPFSNSFAHVPRESENLPWFRDDSSAPHMFLTSLSDYRSTAFNQPPDPTPYNPYTPRFAPAHPVDNSEPIHVDEGLTSAGAPTGGVQTPPPMPASDVVDSSPSPPNRRTKVSIGEIVEDPPQPPTPTSVTSLKRKADVLEEDDAQVVNAIDEPASTVDAPVEISATEAATTTTEQRPRKRLRAIGHAAKKTATYLAPAALTYLFFSAKSVDGFFDGRIA